MTRLRLRELKSFVQSYTEAALGLRGGHWSLFFPIGYICRPLQLAYERGRLCVTGKLGLNFRFFNLCDLEHLPR